ncbi:phage integrase N-terminal SAM-like domain-containing protein [Laribacter hongkongensis]|uniref:phage integrase N-terminal SAM-like domain-containing protein n=1 Tax=Laribacter hongkongensis TaxID=168471 RepID=UPI003570974C
MRRFLCFHHHRHPREMGAAEVSRFLTHLAVEGQVSHSLALRLLRSGYRSNKNSIPHVDAGCLCRVIKRGCFPPQTTRSCQACGHERQCWQTCSIRPKRRRTYWRTLTTLGRVSMKNMGHLQVKRPVVFVLAMSRHGCYIPGVQT